MIIGDGMIANAFKKSDTIKSGICIFASGVANSSCNDVEDFRREAYLLRQKLDSHDDADIFVYFGTCSVYDPSSRLKPYVIHKLAMEKMVQSKPFGVIIRLPQVAGPNANSFTLLSMICESIRIGREINIWDSAVRNIIDVDDVVKIVTHLISAPTLGLRLINVANSTSYPIKTIVQCAESVLNRKAIINTISAGAIYNIDISSIEPLLSILEIHFNESYLSRVIKRYYR